MSVSVGGTVKVIVALGTNVGEASNDGFEVAGRSVRESAGGVVAGESGRLEWATAAITVAQAAITVATAPMMAITTSVRIFGRGLSVLASFFGNGFNIGVC